MAKRKGSKREFKKSNPYLGGILGAVIFSAIIFFVSDGAEGIKAAIPFVAILIGLAIFNFVFDVVWVSTSSPKVYHVFYECGGGDKKRMLRFKAKSMSLEPCAKCHNIKGMGRK